MNRFDAVSFVLQKAAIYALFTIPIIAPTIYGFIRFDELWKSLALGLIGGVIAMHFVITDDSKEGHKGLAKLIMRKRHFKKLSGDKLL